MDRVKSSKLNLKMRRGRRRAGSRLEIFSLHSFLGFSSSPLFHLSVPRFCRLISPQPEVARQSGGGVYILYSLFHMREHVFKKKKKEKNKKSLLKINEAVWRQAMTGALPTLTIAWGISNSTQKEKESKCVFVDLWFWRGGGVWLRSIFQLHNRIKTGVGVDCPPSQQYRLLLPLPYVVSSALTSVTKKQRRGLWQTVAPQWSVMDNTRGKYFQSSKRDENNFSRGCQC